MRISVRFLALGTAATLLASPVVGQRPDDQILPQSIEFQKQGEAELSAGNLSGATDLLETSVAIDPRNRSAFIDLARVAKKEKLFGKAIRLANEALELEPNDLDAIEVQGEAMVELGAIPRAKENLAKLQKLCSSNCRQVAALSSAINRGPTVASVSPPKSPKRD